MFKLIKIFFNTLDKLENPGIFGRANFLKKDLDRLYPEISGVPVFLRAQHLFAKGFPIDECRAYLVNFYIDECYNAGRSRKQSLAWATHKSEWEIEQYLRNKENIDQCAVNYMNR